LQPSDCETVGYPSARRR